MGKVVSLMRGRSAASIVGSGSRPIDEDSSSIKKKGRAIRPPVHLKDVRKRECLRAGTNR